MIDLTTPQRQSPKGIVVFIAKALKKIVKFSWPLLVIAVTKQKDDNSWMLYIAFSIIGLSLLYSILEFIFQKFYIDEEKEEFIIEKGLLNKSKTVIQFAKIQQVNLNQRLIHQIFDVYELEIETAGSTKTEVKLDAISDDVAETLKARLISHQEAPSFSPSAVEELNTESNSMITISSASLFKHGITTNYFKTFWIIIAFGLSILDNLLNYLNWDDDKILSEMTNVTELRYEIKTIIFTICAIFLVIITFNLIVTFIRFARYSIEKTNENLSISYGLFDTKSSIIKPARIQMSYITQNKFQQLFNVQQFTILQTSTEEKDKKKRNGIEIPGLSQQEKDVLFEQIYPNEVEKNNPIKPKLIRFIQRFLLFACIPSAVIFYHATLEKSLFYAGIGVIYLLFVTLYTAISYRNYRLFFNDHYIIVQNGCWDVTTYILEPHKIQSISYQQYFWQKKFNTGNVKIVTAGGTIRFSTTQIEPLLQRVNYWLYQVESTQKNWF